MRKRKGAETAGEDQQGSGSEDSDDENAKTARALAEVARYGTS